MTIVLAPVLDTPAAGPLLATLKKAGHPLTINGSAVECVGQACLQVLVAAARAGVAAGAPLRLEAPSTALAEMATLAGLDPLLAA